MTKFNPIYLVIALLFALAGNAEAQCKLFTQKKCFSALDTYTNNGAYNGAIMYEGEEATMVQTFYAGQDYRLVLCTQEVLASVAYFEVTDFSGNILYTSKGTGSNIFDFSVEITQSLKIRIVVPVIGNNQNTKQNGCVSILVGFKGSETGEADFQYNQFTQ